MIVGGPPRRQHPADVNVGASSVASTGGRVACFAPASPPALARIYPATPRCRRNRNYVGRRR
eukprot:3416410-Lingulodinium_polyedra.AAC.1